MMYSVRSSEVSPAMHHGKTALAEFQAEGVEISVYTATQEGFEDYQGFQFHATGGKDSRHRKQVLEKFLQAINHEVMNNKPTEVNEKTWYDANCFPDGSQAGDDIRLINEQDIYVRAGSAVVYGERYVTDLQKIIKAVASK